MKPEMPNRIWSWWFHKGSRDDAISGGWTETPDARETEYVRADIVADLLSALEAVVNAYENGGMIEPIQQAIAALAKAKGQP